jgi:hypothetical protein
VAGRDELLLIRAGARLPKDPTIGSEQLTGFGKTVLSRESSLPFCRACVRPREAAKSK